MAGGEHVRSGPVKLTYDDLLMLPDDGKRHEIVDGEHYVTPSPFTKHQPVSMNLTQIFVRYLDRQPIGYLSAESKDSLTTPLLPQLEAPLADVFAPLG